MIRGVCMGQTRPPATASTAVACSGGLVVGPSIDGSRALAASLHPSVNGFADDQSVVLVDGVKRTAATRWPERLLIDTDVLTRALWSSTALDWASC
jgi:hypothetical protein